MGDDANNVCFFGAFYIVCYDPHLLNGFGKSALIAVFATFRPQPVAQIIKFARPSIWKRRSTAMAAGGVSKLARRLGILGGWQS